MWSAAFAQRVTSMLVIRSRSQGVLVAGGARYLNRSLVHTDERAKVEAELLAGIEVVKCATWEVSRGLLAQERGIVLRAEDEAPSCLRAFRLKFPPWEVGFGREG